MTALKYTIYIDVLFCVNFIVDYIILLSVKKFRNLSTRTIRLLLGAFVGAIGSLAILLPLMPFWLSWLLNISEALLITAAAFLPMRLSGYLKTAASLFLISFCYCGVMTAILTLFSPKNLIIRNSTVYIGISPIMLVALTLICYIIMKAILKLTGRRAVHAISYEIEIYHQGKQISLTGTVDTGNTLHEPFSGECVMVAKADLFKEMLDVKKYMNSDSKEIIRNGVRLIPFKSVGGSGVIPAFKPSKIYLKDNHSKKEVHAYLGLCSEENLTDECDLLVPAELIQNLP